MIIKKFINKLIKKNNRKLSKFMPSGFHGDKHLGNIVFSCLKKSEQFIETGGNVGSTLHFVASNFTDIPAYSCEPDEKAFNYAKKNISNLNNAKIFKELSPDMIIRLSKEIPELLDKTTTFWLDAHQFGYKWPLHEEVSFITNNFKKGFIFIDDFEVPHIKDFKFSQYEKESCNFEYIENDINQNIEHKLFYPNYKEVTSAHHPLTGWGLIVFGEHNDLDFLNNENIINADKIKR